MIHEPANDRIDEQPNGEGLRQIITALVEEADEDGRTCGQVCVPFVEEGDEFVEGSWVPEIWIVVRKVLPDGR